MFIHIFYLRSIAHVYTLCGATLSHDVNATRYRDLNLNLDCQFGVSPVNYLDSDSVIGEQVNILRGIFVHAIPSTTFYKSLYNDALGHQRAAIDWLILVFKSQIVS